MAMTLEKLPDEARGYAVQAVYDAYYGQGATQPQTVEAFKEELQTKLEALQPPPDDASPIIEALMAELGKNHAGDPTAFAEAFLLDEGYKLPDPVTGLLYDQSYNYYLHAENAPRLFLDKDSGLYRDTEEVTETTNWYDSNGEHLEKAPTPAAASPELEEIIRNKLATVISQVPLEDSEGLSPEEQARIAAEELEKFLVGEIQKAG